MHKQFGMRSPRILEVDDEKRVRCAVLLALTLLAAALPALAKSLHWPSMEVTARLEANGDLRIKEILVYQFDGDWNGGERSWNLRPGQSVTIQSMHRIDPASGARVALEEGSLDEVNHWKETSPGVLRWRARRPSDPPFKETRIAYEIAYTYRGAVVKAAEELRIAHDFAFANRDGSIDRFKLTLELDSVWKAPVLGPLVREQQDLPPGEGVVVPLTLGFTGDTAELVTITPEQLAAEGSAPPPVAQAGKGTRRAISAALLALAAVLLVLFFVHESRVGRFVPVDPTPVDEAWLSRETFAHPPEVIGAAWDESVGSEEVAAVMMRLQREGRIDAQFAPKERGSQRFVLRLKQPIESFSGYERNLLDGYFFAGDTVTDDMLRTHYRASGFNPGALLQPGLMERASKLVGEPPPARTRQSSLIALAFVVGPVLTVLGVPSGARLPAGIGTFVGTLLVSVIAGVLGSWFRGRIDRGSGALFRCGIPAWLALAAAVVLAARAPLSTLALAGISVTALVVLAIFLTSARSLRGAESMAGRKRLARARFHFERELAKPQPALRDEWHPWIVAFGLGDRVDGWAKSFGGASSTRSMSRSSDWSGSSSGSSSVPSWTGGGGAFGGAGASAAWAAASSSIASAKSSSSSGGGSSSSSSGGGGGGGW
jgi:uncharacterized membrane protein YgcG